MEPRFYLIQRGSFKNIDEAHHLFGGSPGHLIDPDYMGSSEFEWGAIPKAYCRIMGQFDKYSLHITDLITVGGVPFCLYCRDDHYNEILEAIKNYLKKDYQLKEPSHMTAHFDTSPTDKFDTYKKYLLKTNFWLCIDTTQWDNPYNYCIGDWMAFIGATDRQRAFSEVINNDYNEVWCSMDSATQKSRFLESF